MIKHIRVVRKSDGAGVFTSRYEGEIGHKLYAAYVAATMSMGKTLEDMADFVITLRGLGSAMDEYVLKAFDEDYVLYVDGQMEKLTGDGPLTVADLFIKG